MLIGVCGFTSTGSSAVSDFLKEFSDNQVFDDLEFDIAFTPDGLEDMEHHIMNACSKYTSSNVAITRFRNYVNKSRKLNKATQGASRELTERYLDKLVQVRWKGYGAVDTTIYPGRAYKYVRAGMLRLILPQISRLLKKNVDLFPVRDMELSIRPENFYEATVEYIYEILKAMGCDGEKNIVLDQPFAGNDPAKSFRFFREPHAIIVDRDPRDNYLFAKKFLLHVGRQIPTQRVEDFVTYYRAMRKDMPYLEERPDILRVRLEDMIYEYESTTEKIVEFCKIKDHVHKRKVFIPEKSKNNTQLFLRYPECEEEVKYIEKELPEYLYPFEKYGKNNTDGLMFYGKSSEKI